MIKYKNNSIKLISCKIISIAKNIKIKNYVLKDKFDWINSLLLVFSAYATAIPGYENTKQCIEFICKNY